MFLGNWDIDDYLTFTACTHDDTGAAADADAVPSYAIYEDETATAIVSGNMTRLGAVTGFYTERVQLTAAAGFEAGKMYAIRVEAVMGGVMAAAAHSFAVKVASANVTLWKGTAPSDLVSGEVPGKLSSSSGQMIANATKLAPDAGMPAIGSVAYILPSLPTEADVQAAAAAALAAYDPPTLAELTSAVAPLALEATVGALPTAAENADAVLDELLSGHTIPGSAGAGIAAAGTADDPWITVLPGSYNSGTAGAIIGALAAIDTTAVTITPANNAGHLTITAARTFEATISGLTIPANWVTALWTLKTDDSRPDVAALVQLRETNPAALSDGLQRLNGAALPSGVTAAAGSLTVNQAGGSVVVWLSDEVTARLGKATGIGWDVKFIDAAGDSDGADGTADVALTETKATA